MNKFVKGAKNLAFALSFVTIAACGGVKKADLETLEKSFNEKIGGKADKDSCVSKNELASLKSEIGNEVGEKIKSGVEGLKKETVRLDVLDKAFVNSPEGFVKLFGGDVKLSNEVFKSGKVTFSDWADKGVCKVKVEVGGKGVFEVSTAAVLSDVSFDVLKGCIGGGAEVVWGGDVFFVKEDSKGIKFIDKNFDVEDNASVLSLARLLDLCYLAGKKFEDLKFNCWKVEGNNKIGDKEFKKGNKESYKMLVDVLNKFKEGCCVMEGEKVTFKGNMGWTNDGGSTGITTDVVIVLQD